MNVLIQQDPSEEYGLLHPANGRPWVWAVLGDDVKVPHANGREKTHAEAVAAAEAASTLPAPVRFKYESAVYPVADGKWRWCVWRGEYQVRPIYGGVCATAHDADRMTFYCDYHVFRNWQNYDDPYRGEFAGGELLDPLTVQGVARV